jgi:hypothetical protein
MSCFCYSQSIIQMSTAIQCFLFWVKRMWMKWDRMFCLSIILLTNWVHQSNSWKCSSFQTLIDENYITCSNKYRFTRICVCDCNVRLWLPVCPSWQNSLYLVCGFLHARGRQQGMCHCWVVVWCQPAMNYPMLYEASSVRYAFDCSSVKDTWYQQ